MMIEKHKDQVGFSPEVHRIGLAPAGDEQHK